MNKAAAIQQVSTFAGPIVLAVGTSMVTAALVSAAIHDRYSAQAGPAPAPTVTVTATAAEQTPAPRPSLTASGSTVVQAQPASRTQMSGGRTAGSTGRSGGSSSTGPRPAPGPSTSPPGKHPAPSPTAAANCRGALADAQALNAVCVTVGGSR